LACTMTVTQIGRLDPASQRTDPIQCPVRSCGICVGQIIDHFSFMQTSANKQRVAYELRSLYHAGKRSSDRLCGLVFTVPDYRSKGSGFDSRRYQIFGEVLGLKRGPLSLVKMIEELFGRIVRVRVTLRLTVGQSVCLGVELRPGLMTRCLLTL
jgi:hypothetical protein